MSVEKMLEKSIESAARGRTCWINLVEENQIGDGDAVILMPDVNADNILALKYIDAYAGMKNTKNIYLLTHDEAVIQSAAKRVQSVSNLIYCSRQEAEDLMKFYSLYEFTDKLIIASLSEPEGRSGEKLVGKKGITREEVMAIGVFGLREA